MIGYTSERIDNWVLLKSNCGEPVFSNDPMELFRYLRQGSPMETRFVWGLSEFVAPLIRLLNAENHELVLRLIKEGKAEYRGIRLFYVQDEILSVNEFSIFELQQWFPTDEPAPVSEQQIADKGQQLADALKTMGITTRTYMSPLKMFKEAYIKPRHLVFPAMLDLDKPLRLELNKYALRCDKTQWVTNYKVGSWGEGEVTDYDVTTSYPARALDVGDIRDASFLFSTKMIQAQAGLLRGKIHINKGCFCPLLTARQDGHFYAPSGDWSGYVTLDEVRFIERWGLGTFKLQDGWFITYRSYDRPYAETMNTVYQWRQLGRIQKHISKRISVMWIGAQRQIVGRHTDNPEFGRDDDLVSHALITSKSRMWIANQIMNYGVKESEIVSFEVDGFRLTRKLPLPKLDLRRWNSESLDLPPMGTLREEGAPALVTLSPTRIYTLDKNPGGQGVTIKRLLAAINESPDSSLYEWTTKRMIQPSELFTNENAKVGEMYDYPTHIDLQPLGNLRLEQNRLYGKLPTTGGELLSHKYSSQPIELTLQ